MWDTHYEIRDPSPEAPMTFRGRLVLAAAVAVAVAVALSAAAAFFASSNAVLNSVDDLLQSRATGGLERAVTQNGEIDQNSFFPGDKACVVAVGSTCPPGTVPTKASMYRVARGAAPPYFATIDIDGRPFREYVTYISPYDNYSVQDQNGFYVPIPIPGAALVLATPLSGVNSQLDHLRLVLAFLVAAGVALAVLLGWMVARTTLGPVNDLTSSVEGIADTLDVTRRLTPGGPDELGRLRRAFNRLLSALESSQSAQRQLVLDASHELRTPLTSLRTNLEVVRRIDDLSPEDRRVLVDDVLTQLEELTNLVGDLAELARGDHRQEEAVLLRLDQLVADAVSHATTHGRPRNVTFTIDLQETWVVGHHDRITHAVANLLDNALKWSPPGGVVEVSGHDGSVVVRDHGPGISEEDLPYVFNRFYRAKAARALPGSGLGLAIVAQVAAEEGGSVEAGQAEGGGAVMVIRIPAVLTPVQVTAED
ncbi:MAG TPA: HAMP domain-containing sensor histidine kinase [Acidimicrobiales bacterium]|nr:HAMP domain-containing sensor histidine kinase [Acidimicrobiales bacterium]